MDMEICHTLIVVKCCNTFHTILFFEFIRKRCKVIGKGEVYEKKLFTSKNTRFKQEDFLDEVKLFYTRMINHWVTDEKDRLTVFDRNGPYLATKKIGRNNPKEHCL